MLLKPRVRTRELRLEKAAKYPHTRARTHAHIMQTNRQPCTRQSLDTRASARACTHACERTLS